MSVTTSARGYDWSGSRIIDLWKWYKEDADLAALSEREWSVLKQPSANPYRQMAAAKLQAIERKLKEVPARSGWCFALASGVPDADRVYGSAYGSATLGRPESGRGEKG